MYLLPGMAVSVEAADTEGEATTATIRVPLAAVAADAQGQPGVWVVGQDGRVRRRPVRTGAIVGADIVVASGLAGERIVAAGVGALREGMAVRPLESPLSPGPRMNIAEYTIRKAVVAWVATLLVLAGGWLAYERLGRFEDPEFVIRQAVVVTAYPGATPAQVAEEITDRIEGAVQQMQEVEEVISVSRAGESLVKVEAKLAFSRTPAELDQVWDKLRSKIAEAARRAAAGRG